MDWCSTCWFLVYSMQVRWQNLCRCQTTSCSIRIQQQRCGIPFSCILVNSHFNSIPHQHYLISLTQWLVEDKSTDEPTNSLTVKFSHFIALDLTQMDSHMDGHMPRTSPDMSCLIPDAFWCFLVNPAVNQFLSDFIASDYLAGASLLSSLKTMWYPQKFINLVLHY